MRFGLFTSMGNQTWPGVLELWRHSEATGWDIGCVTDHFMPNNPQREGTTLEAWSTLSALAALVPRMKRSEERRVGKGGRYQWTAAPETKNAGKYTIQTDCD